jgi:hypothetical protein
VLLLKTIERVRRVFCEEGMEMFTLKIRSDKKIDGRVEAHLITLLCQSPRNLLLRTTAATEIILAT